MTTDDRHGSISCVPRGLRAVGTPVPRVSVFPLVNVLAALMPFLLLSSRVDPLATMTLQRPSEKAALAPVAAAVAVTIAMTPTVFTVGVQGPGLSAAQLKALGSRIPRRSGDGFKALSAALYDIKQRYPDSHAITLLPGPSVPYEDVIATLDSVRQRAVPREERTTMEPLFPSVTLGKT